jgi:hypothetical protein
MHFDIARVEQEIEITRIFPELEERLIGTFGLWRAFASATNL